MTICANPVAPIAATVSFMRSASLLPGTTSSKNPTAEILGFRSAISACRATGESQGEGEGGAGRWCRYQEQLGLIGGLQIVTADILYAIGQ